MFSFLISALGANAADKASPNRGRSLKMEALESREVLSAAGLVDVGAQPDGGLDGKIVYLHGGHGRTYSNGSWGYQRPLLLDMVEDHGNQDQMTFLADYLWNAGATVVPLRPIGHQLNEVLLDNDDAGVTFDGAWGTGAGGTYYGDPGDTPYRFATTSATETAVATYRPDLPEDGFYPVYTWATPGTNRATDQLYRIHHTGGATEVTIDHSRVGNGLVYLGTFHFDEGTEGYVEISNRSDEVGKVVIADMIRFGNGIGDINLGGGISGTSRENEAGLYWLRWHAENAVGVPSSAYGTSTVSAPPKYAAYMNQSGVGTLSDRLFLSFHSNASTGNPATASARGVVGLHNTANGGATPNQFFLADIVAASVNDDMILQAGQFEHNWQNRSGHTFQANFNYGEINNSNINNEFDATIIETGFHDNTLDAEMLRDPRVRDAIARATYQGIVDYFNTVDGGATANLDLPPRVEGLTAESTVPGSVTLTWDPGTASAYAGGTTTGFMLYKSIDGYGFDGGTPIAGGATTTHTVTGLDTDQNYYFKLVATNAAGHSLGSEVAAAKPSGSSEQVLIVNGFDRLDRSLVPTEPFPGGGESDRVRPRYANSYDYAVQVAEAMSDAGATAEVSTATNEQVASGAVDLSDYDAVFWILGEESSGSDTFNTQEQTAASNYLAGGGKLFVSGAEIGWDLDNLNNGRTFYNNTLRADYVADDAGTYDVNGAPGSIFEGLSFSFDDGTQFYDAQFPDVIATSAGSAAALSYNGGAGGTAAVQYAAPGDGERLVMLAFPFETITTPEDRADVMGKVLEYFQIDANPPQTVSVLLDNDTGSPTYSETGFWITSGDPGFDGLTQRFNLIGFEGAATWQTDLNVSGEAEVFVQYDADTNRATGAHYTVTHPGGSFTKVIDQRLNDFAWVSLGSFDTTAGPISVTLDAMASTGPSNTLVIADVVRIDVRGAVAAPNGDFNADGTVDAADYTVWRDTQGDLVTPGDGADVDQSGVIDQGDYDIWVATYGQSVPATSAAVAKASASEGPNLSAAVLTAPTLQTTPTTPPEYTNNGIIDSMATAHQRGLLLLVGQPEPSRPVTPTDEARLASHDEAFADEESSESVDLWDDGPTAL